MEVADDIGLAQMMKANGGRADLLLAIDWVSVEWYNSLKDLIRGLEKNAFSQIARFSLFRGLLFFLLMLWFALSPLLLLLFGSHPIAVTIALLGILGAAWTSTQIKRMSGEAAWMVLTSFVVGDLVLAFVILRSSILGFWRGGVIWRGTVYPSSELKKGVRVKL